MKEGLRYFKVTMFSRYWITKDIYSTMIRGASGEMS